MSSDAPEPPPPGEPRKPATGATDAAADREHDVGPPRTEAIEATDAAADPAPDVGPRTEATRATAAAVDREPDVGPPRTEATRATAAAVDREPDVGPPRTSTQPGWAAPIDLAASAAPAEKSRVGPSSSPLDSPSEKRGRRWLRRIRKVIEAGTIVVGLGALLLWCSVPNPSRLASENPTSTAFIDLRRAQAADAGQALRLEWQWRPLGKISRYLRAAIIYAEDYNFYRHDGVDWDAVEAAFDANWNRGALAIGGSTITQQLAKNLYLSPSRSFVRKLRELLIAYRLEDELSKQRILELYLNVVEWGDGVFGAEAAARHWFGHSAQNLSPAEAARLAIALPNPKTRAPNIATTELTRKAVRLIHLLRLQGLIDPAQERLALDQVGAPDENILPSRPAPVSRPAPGQPDTDTGGAPARPDIDPPTDRPDIGPDRPDTGPDRPDTGPDRPDTGPSVPDTGQASERPDTEPARPDRGASPAPPAP